jgi:hypothetical protein
MAINLLRVAPVAVTIVAAATEALAATVAVQTTHYAASSAGKRAVSQRTSGALAHTQSAASTTHIRSRARCVLFEEEQSHSCIYRGVRLSSEYQVQLCSV